MNIGKCIQSYSEELRFKNYSKNTIDNYACQVEVFLKYFNGKVTKPSEINEKQIKDWLMLANTTNSMRHRLSAVKLFYRYVVKQPMKFKHIEYPRSEQHLPQPLSYDEVKKLFEVCENKKHKAILGLLFMSGLRVGEVIKLKPSHIDRANMIIHIIQAKGMKDRIVPMSASLLKLLEEYFREYRPKEYMFNGQFDLMYSERSINQFIKDLGAKAGIKKRLHSHLGRHSCFSQMLANGIELALIQKVAGHKNIKTTAIYAKITPPTISRLQAYDF